MKQKQTFLRRALSLVLSLAVVFPATLALIGDSGTAQAAGTKTSINVLAIEPSDSDLLTASTVNSWGYTGTVNITYVSTLEFNGIKEDLSENYDLIYVGDNGGSTTGLNLDTNYLYANIGKTVTMPESAVGLTDAEYKSGYLPSPYGTYRDLQYPVTNTRYSGNDLSAAQLAALNKYAVEGRPVIYGSGLTSGTVVRTTEPFSFKANLSGVKSGSNLNFTASPVATTGTIPASFTPTYEWYLNGTQISGAISSTYSDSMLGKTNGTYTYYCKISYTVNGTPYTAMSNNVVATVTAATASVSYSGTNTAGVAAYQYYTNKWRSGTYRYSVAISNTGATLNVALAKTSTLTVSDIVYDYKWYNSSNVVIAQGTTQASTNGSTTISYTPTANGTYYCRITLNSLVHDGNITDYFSNTTIGWTRDAILTNYVSASASITTGAAGLSIPVPARNPENFSIDTTKVDNCSNMYTFLDSNKSRLNIMRTTDIDSTALLNAINLSKPTINLTAYPTSYTSMTGATLAADVGSSPSIYTLSYTFTIANATDPSPASTSYYCYLAIDSNADGTFGTGERLSNLVIKSGGTVITSGNLKSGTVYTATCTLPAGTYGIIPWQLKVIDTGAGIVNASRIGYTRLAPVAGKAKVLNILQINSSSGLSLDNTTNASLNGSSALNTTWSTFNTLFNAVSADYDINIQTVTTSAINSIGTTGITNKLDGKNTPYTDVAAFLNSYDLVIMGIGGTDTNYFDALTVGDGITDYDLNEATTNAIAGYLNSKPVLFTHDTTSWMNLPYPYEATWNGSNMVYSYYPFYGYFINTVLRDSFGLDRYGVTNDTYGHTKMSNPSLSSSGLVARGYSGITDDDKTALLGNGYSIAYLPGSNKATFVTTTQGFSNYISTISHSSTTTATTVSQVNEGQVSSYPYDINSGTFTRATAATATVASTHAQYYQVNMNSADTSVFYCLNNSAFKFNDVSNAPYIYRRRNVTFSDFGNTVGSLSSSAETKLFVNTIIAASGVFSAAPEVKFSDASGSKVLANYLMPFDNFGILTTSGSTGKDRNLYFTISGGASIVSATIGYGTGTDTVVVPIYDSTGSPVISSAALESNQIYYMKIDDVWAALPSATKTTFASGSTGAVIPITVKVASGSLENSATVYLRKLLLFDLG